MNKRIISLLLVIVMALSLVACGAAEAPAATEAPATNDTPMQYIKPWHKLPHTTSAPFCSRLCCARSAPYCQPDFP